MVARETPTRDRIVEATRDLLLSDGLDKLSMRKIAQRVGISAPAIYRHFDDKDALLSSAVHAGALTFTAYLVKALCENDARTRLHSMCLHYFEFAAEHPADYRLLFVVNCEEIGYDQLDQSARSATQHTFQLLVDRVTECQNEGVFRPGDPVEQAVFIWSSIHGLATLGMTGHLSVEPSVYQRTVETQIDWIFRALAPLGGNHTTDGR